VSHNIHRPFIQGEVGEHEQMVANALEHPFVEYLKLDTSMVLVASQISIIHQVESVEEDQELDLEEWHGVGKTWYGHKEDSTHHEHRVVVDILLIPVEMNTFVQIRDLLLDIRMVKVRSGLYQELSDR
jgi:hypothetical protein